MDGFLRQSTASQVRTIGPFVDDTDFKSLENGLTIANTDIVIKKNGAASGTKNSGGATADTAGGLYHLTWDATDTGTVGELAYSVLVSGALVVFGKYVVLEEAVYDALFAASAPGYVANQPVDVNTIKTQAVTCAAGVTVLASVGTAATSTAQTGDSFARIGATGSGLTSLSSQASVDDLPTNAELATALGTADDAVLTQIALVKAKSDLIPGTQDGLTFAQQIVLIASVLLGKASGLATTTAAYRAADDSKARVTATVDADGNRSAVTLDAS